MDDGFNALRVAWSALIVAVIAVFMFGRPSWARTFTTRAAFWTAALGSATIYVLLFLLCYQVLRHLFVGLGILSDQTRAGPRVIAIVIAVCAIGLPLVGWPLRNLLHRLAGVPDVAHRFARNLYDSPLVYDDEIRVTVRRMLMHRDIDLDADELPLVRPLHQQLERAGALYQQILGMAEARRYRHVFSEARMEFAALRQRFDRALAQASRALAQIGRVGELRILCGSPILETAGATDGDDPAAEADELMRTIVNIQISDICEEVGLVYRDTCLLVARAVISCNPGPASRSAVFAELGFRLQPEKGRLGYQGLLRGSGWILMFVVIFFAAFGAPHRMLPPWAMIVVITLTQVGALAAAIVPKTHFAFASSGLRDRTPWMFLAVAGILALGWTLALNAVAGGLANGLPGIMTRLRELIPYLPAAVVTAVTCAWLVQDYRWSDIASERTRRMLDAVVMASAWVCVSLAGQAIGVLRHDTVPTIVVFAGYLLYSLVMGGVIGYLVPHLARFGSTYFLQAGENASIALRRLSARSSPTSILHS
jgi:hypothetical protein